MVRTILIGLYIAAVAVACSTLSKGPVKPAPNWENDPEYLEALADKDFRYAREIAEEKKLGRQAVLNAARLEMWQYADEDNYSHMAERVAAEVGFSKKEQAGFAQEIFNKKVKEGRCQIAADAAHWFDLGRSYIDAAVKCEIVQNGIASALNLACYREASQETIDSVRAEFLAYFGTEWNGDRDYDHHSMVIERCTFAAEDYVHMYEKLLELKEHDLPIKLIRVAEEAGADLPFQEMWRRLFRITAKDGQLRRAVDILQQESFIKNDEDLQVFIDESVKRFECGHAFEVAYLYSLGDDVIEGIFQKRKCFGNELTEVASVIEGADGNETEWYFHLALRHYKFHLAWILAKRVPKDPWRYGPKGAYGSILDEAYKVGAHSAVINLLPPPLGMSVRRFRREVLEHALYHGEEWFVARYAHGRPDGSTESWVERAYLRAIERGEYLLAAQIARKYGDKGCLKIRAVLVFELAMLAKMPGKARMIMRICEIETPERRKRVALLLYKQKQKRRKAVKKKKRCKKSGDWKVKRSD